MQTLFRDVHHAWRVLRKNPSFTAVATVTLAFGIGASVANFAVVRGVLLRPLPYGDSTRLVRVYDANPAHDSNMSAFSPQDLDDFSRQQDVFSELGGYWYSPGSGGLSLSGAGEPAYLETVFAGNGLFPTLGVRPLLGRPFLPEENVAGKDAVAILSYGTWQKQFHSDPEIIGRKILLDGAPNVVVAVMPASFQFPSRNVDLWMPLSRITDSEIPHFRGLRWISLVARLKTGVSIEQAATGSSLVLRRLEQQFPDSNAGWNRAVVADLRDDVVGQVRPALLALLTAGLLVLLLASANLANLLLARATVRQREFAIRSALGGGRWQLRRQVLTENLVLACVGGAMALALSPSIASLLLEFSAGSIPRADAVRIDWAVVLFAAGLTLLTGILIGIIPAVKVAGRQLVDALKAASTSVAGDSRRQGSRDALVMAEIALACTLLAVSGLVLRSLWKLVSTDPGFDSSHVLAVQLSLPEYKYHPAPKMEAYRDELLRRVAAAPGVEAAGGSKTMPLFGGGEPYQFSIQDAGRALVDVTPTSGTYIVTPGYFQALKIPLVTGRTFDQKDFADHSPVVIVNEQLARTFWPGVDPVGKSLHLGKSPKDKVEVIGVVGDVRNEGLRQESGTAVYFPESRAPRQKLNIFVRTRADPLTTAAAIRRIIHGFEPDQAINDMASLEQVMHETVSQPRFLTAVLSAFGGTALLLASLGVFGVISYNVRQRTREIGVRMALGADRHDVLLMIMQKATRRIAIGLAGGLVLTIISGRFLSGILYGVSPSDPLALAAAVAVLALVALFAAVIPAQRATRVDPVVALRYE
jgi:predicted permease